MEYELINKSIYFPKEEVLAIADLHFGYEQSLEEAGVFLPKSQFKETLKDLNLIFKNLKRKKKIVKEIVIIGDLKHEFSGTLSQEWKEVIGLMGYLEDRVRKIVLVKGNHDNYLAKIVKNKAKIVNCYIKNSMAFLHGHKLFVGCLDKKIETLVLGHKHPAFTIRGGVKSERYKCFLVGNYKGKEVIILPSFFPFVEGSDVVLENLEDSNLAFEFDLRKFKVYAIGDKIYDFGYLKKTINENLYL